MTTTVTGTQLATGLRRAVVFALSSGYPAASGTSPYEGLETIGPKAYALSEPDVRRINHVGGDSSLALDFLPATEGVTAELRVAGQDIPLDAFLSGVKVMTIGESKVMAAQTDQQGYEPDVALILFQQSLDTLTKSRNWKYYVVPKARVVAFHGNMDENPAESRYQIAPNPSTKHLWGSTMTVAGAEGASQSGFLVGHSEGRPAIIAWKADGSTLAYLFPTSKPATAVGKVVVWVNGVEQTTGITVTTTGVTFDVAPTLNAMIVAKMEY